MGRRVGLGHAPGLNPFAFDDAHRTRIDNVPGAGLASAVLTSTRAFASRDAWGARDCSRDPRPETTHATHASAIDHLQSAVGNRALALLIQSIRERQRAEDAGADHTASLLKRADAEAGWPLDPGVRHVMEPMLHADLAGVRVHGGRASEAAAAALNARAYAIGSKIFLGSAARTLCNDAMNRLLAHEAVHTVQQGSQPVALQGILHVSQPGDGAETEADGKAGSLDGAEPSRPLVAGALPAATRPRAARTAIQRDIVGTQRFPHGELAINLEKHDADGRLDNAEERGKITFTPSPSAPDFQAIRFVQISRATDKSSGEEVSYDFPRDPHRLEMSTSQDKDKGILPGYHVDLNHSELRPRPTKRSKVTLPYYDATGPGQTGSKNGKVIVPATLEDTPGNLPVGRFFFQTSAIDATKGMVLGTVFWGFELSVDEKGVQKIRDEEPPTFQASLSPTAKEALRLFDAYYKNPPGQSIPKK